MGDGLPMRLCMLGYFTEEVMWEYYNWREYLGIFYLAEHEETLPQGIQYGGVFHLGEYVCGDILLGTFYLLLYYTR